MKMNNWQLVHVCKDTGAMEPAKEAEILNFSSGETCTLYGGSPPQHTSSSGRVYVKIPGCPFPRECFPQVFDMKWIPLNGS